MFKIQTEQDEPRGGHLSIPAIENARDQQPIKKKERERGHFRTRFCRFTIHSPDASLYGAMRGRPIGWDFQSENYHPRSQKVEDQGQGDIVSFKGVSPSNLKIAS